MAPGGNVAPDAKSNKALYFTVAAAAGRGEGGREAAWMGQLADDDGGVIGGGGDGPAHCCVAHYILPLLGLDVKHKFAT